MDGYKENARIFKALCDESRLRILSSLQGGERCACELLDELNIQQSTLSHHMRILCDAGVVKARRDGKRMLYSIDREGSLTAQVALRQLLEISGASVDPRSGKKQ